MERSEEVGEVCEERYLISIGYIQGQHRIKETYRRGYCGTFLVNKEYLDR